jgi:ferric-dicitrate binding protein FerR (iron transport regulator)
MTNTPRSHSPLSDDQFRQQIAAAMRDLDRPETDSEIETALDSIPPEPLTEGAIDRILGRMISTMAIGVSDDRATSVMAGHLHDVSEVKPSRQTEPALVSHGPIRRPTTSTTVSPASQIGIVALCLTLTLLIAIAIPRGRDLDRTAATSKQTTADPQKAGLSLESLVLALPMSRHVTGGMAPIQVKLGETITTGPREMRRVLLPDGSILSINEKSQVQVVGRRRIKLVSGEVFAEVVPAGTGKGRASVPTGERFIVETPDRSVTALGTKFVVKAQAGSTNVVVTQGSVQVSGVVEVIPAGQEWVADPAHGISPVMRPAKRSAHVLEWVRDLMMAATDKVVPPSEHSGGTILVVDPQGQQTRLSLQKFHVDVHIEDGFARTTIDQTYFNHTWQQLEGTFRFPLPADASLSRLAMYVNGTLMEGGMVERDYGRNVFEQIRHTRRDPALLEWVDGSTFQMRVFPLEARQEKRILLSYTQRLPSDYGKGVYRFPSGHSLEGVRKWSSQIRVRGAAGTAWHSPTHVLSSREDRGDLVIEGQDEFAPLDRDLVVELGDDRHRVASKSDPQWSYHQQDGAQYVMLRQRPELRRRAERGRRHWIFLMENSADRNALLAETQRQIVKVFLENAEHSDTFSLVRAGARTELFRPEPVDCTLENLESALPFLNEASPIGALDLEKSLRAVQQLAADRRDVWVVHLGAGIPVLGQRDQNSLIRLLPPTSHYVGVAVGKRWSKSFMSTAARQTGGHITQINPDDAVAWRAFELLSTLNAPRLTEIAVKSDNVEINDEKTVSYSGFQLMTSSLADGQELVAVARIPQDRKLPKSVTVTGQLNGQPFEQVLTVPPLEPRATVSPCGHLPRTWARLEIDRLVELGAVEFKSQIIELSKAMYVMSPFTSLIVLETDAMYEQFKVDRGRKDHWAMYPAPAQIPVVAETVLTGRTPIEMANERLKSAEARAQLAQANYDRSIREKRPLIDQDRFQRLQKGELAEVQLLKRELERIQQSTAAAEDPSRKALQSVILRRYGWQLGYMQQYPLAWRMTNVWFDDGQTLSARGLDDSLLLSTWDVAFDATRVRVLNGLAEDEVSQRWTIPLSTLSDEAMSEGRFQRLNTWTRPVITSSVRSGPVSLSRVPMLGEDFDYAFGSQPVTYFRTGIPVLNREFSLESMRQVVPFYEAAGNGLVALPQLATFTSITPTDSNGLLASHYFGDYLNAASSGVNGRRSVVGLRYGSSQGLPIIDGFNVVASAPRMYYVHNGVVPQVEYVTGLDRVWLTSRHPLADVLEDVPGYAPGMQTWRSDQLAHVERATNSRPGNGEMDAGARRLIERARSMGWERIRVKGADPRHLAFRDQTLILADGSGRMIVEREAGEGLKEKIVHDGMTLWHLYPEIGLGSRRNFSRFHQGSIQMLIPWYIPSADDLVVDANVTLVGDRTIRITRLNKTPASEVKVGDATSARQSRTDQPGTMELEFAEDGRLVESRIINATTNKVLMRQTIAADGTVRLRDADDRVVAEVRYERQPIDAPDLVPRTEQLVVLPLPYRSSASVPVSVPVNLESNQPDYARLSDDAALTLLATYFAEARSAELTAFVEQRFIARGDHRLGLAVLVSSVAPQSPLVANLTKHHPEEPLARFLEQFGNLVAPGNVNGTLDIGESASPFLKRYCGIYNSHSRWVSGRGAGKEWLAPDVQRELESTLSFLRDCRSADVALKLLMTVQAGLKRAEHLNASTARLLNQTSAAIAEERGIPEFARLARVEWLLMAGDDASANQSLELFQRDVADSLKAGMVPDLTSDLRLAFVGRFGTIDGTPCRQWGEKIRAAAFELDAKKHGVLLVELGRRIRMVAAAESALAAEIVERAVQSHDPADLHFKLIMLQYSMEAGDWIQAEVYSQPLLADKKYGEYSRTWGDAATVAHHRQKYADWIEFLDRESQIEFANLPKAMNLEVFRKSYETLFEKFDQRADQLVSATPADRLALAQIVQRATKRWRDIDTDETAACHRTAKILTKLGLVTAAWDYWTTPLAGTPDQSGPWISFATAMNEQHRYLAADGAWSTAFEMEPTNPEILMQHAQFLRSTGQEHRATEVLTRITSGTWQPRFEPVKSQAHTMLAAPK